MTNSVQFTPIVAIIVAIVVTMFDILWLARPLAEHQEEEGNAEYNPLENGQRINATSLLKRIRLWLLKARCVTELTARVGAIL